MCTFQPPNTLSSVQVKGVVLSPGHKVLLSSREGPVRSRFWKCAD